MNKLLYILLLVSCMSYGQTIRYVSVSGGGDGTSISSTWTLSQLQSNATCDMIAYVQAGNYGSSTYSFSANCTEGTPLEIIGVDASWNEIVLPTRVFTNRTGETEIRNRATYTETDNFSGSDMPFLDSGLTIGNNGSGIGVTIGGSYVTLQNFAVKGYAKGFVIEGTHQTVKNLNADLNGLHSNDNAYGFIQSGVNQNCCSGYNIDMKADNSVMEYCFARDGSHVGIAASGNSIYTDNEVYTSDLDPANNNTGGNSMDYQFLINCIGSTITYTTMYRETGTCHLGHGICLKPNGEDSRDNLIEHFALRNLRVEVQYVRAFDNVIRNGMIISDESGDYAATNITFANGAHDNLVENIYMYKPTWGVTYWDWEDGASSQPTDDGANQGQNNTVNNLIVVNPVSGHIALQGVTNEHGTEASAAQNARIFNATFIGGASLFYYNNFTGALTGGIYNSIVKDVGSFSGGSAGSGSISSAYEFDWINHDTQGYSSAIYSSYSVATGSLDTVTFNDETTGTNDVDFDYGLSTDIVGIDRTSLLVSQGLDYNDGTRTTPFSVGAVEYDATFTNPPVDPEIEGYKQSAIHLIQWINN